MKDVRWLIVGGVVFLGFTGPGTIVSRLKDCVALDLLDSAGRDFLSTVQRIRVLSVIFAGGGVAAYLLSRPFNAGAWVIAGLWLMYSLSLVGRGTQMLKELESKRRR